MQKTLYLIVPCYNEEEIIANTSKQLLNKIKKFINKNKISKNSKILFVNDGSKDDTLSILKNLVSKNDAFICLNLTENVGHQNALLAGLLYSKEYCDMSISLDADLQDDVDKIDEMIEKYYEGFDVVYGVRNDRSSDSFFKRTTAQSYYKLLKKMGANTIYNHADYRLLSKDVLYELDKYNGSNIYLRGIIPTLKFKSTSVYYARKKRELGKSKYSLKNMLKLSIDGFIYSVRFPAILFLLLGFSIAFFSFLSLIILIVLLLLNSVQNYYLIFFAILFLLNGIIILSIGIIGEYILNSIFDRKKYANYRISEVIKNDENIKKVS